MRNTEQVETSKQVSYTRACDTNEQNIIHRSFAKKKPTKLVDLGNGIEFLSISFWFQHPNFHVHDAENTTIKAKIIKSRYYYYYFSGKWKGIYLPTHSY